MFQISLCLYKQREGIVGRAVLQSPEVKGLNWLRRVRVHDLIRQHARPLPRVPRVMEEPWMLVQS